MTSAAEEMDRKYRQATAILFVLRGATWDMTTAQVGAYATRVLGLDAGTVEGRSHPLSLWDTQRTLYVLKWLAEEGDVVCERVPGRRDLRWRHAWPTHSPCEGAESDA